MNDPRNNTSEETPKIEFPCADYPIKIMGKHCDDYQKRMLDIVQRHAPGFDDKKIRTRTSNKGSFRSITVFIVATGVEQLHAMHMDLRADPDTKMVL